MIISLAPLQGITDFAFRKALHETIGGIDKFYTPFLRLEKDGVLKKSQIKDLLPENNLGVPVIPQILTNDSKWFIEIANRLVDFGFTELNWNLGCPYPMVTKRGLGSGLLPHPETIQEILDEVLPKLALTLSIKLRAGLLSDREIFDVLPVLNSFPLTEVIVHPRIARQLYKGTANADVFEECLNHSDHPLAYNGDIDSVDFQNQLASRFPQVTHWMIGRALIANPFLALDIKQPRLLSASEKNKLFFAFHRTLFSHYSQSLSGSSHQLNKLTGLWEYFSTSFSNGKKIFKSIKKSKTVNQFNQIISSVENNESFLM